MASANDYAAIRRAGDGFIRAVNEDDLDGMMVPASDEEIVFPPHEPPHRGSADQRRWHQRRVAAFATHAEMSAEEMIGADDIVFERRSYRMRLTPRTGGASLTDTGTVVWLWRREAAGWKVIRAIWASDQPIAASV